jgi:hypothetical protein
VRRCVQRLLASHSVTPSTTRDFTRFSRVLFDDLAAMGVAGVGRFADDGILSGDCIASRAWAPLRSAAALASPRVSHVHETRCIDVQSLA